MNKLKVIKGRKGQKGRQCKYDITLKRRVVNEYLGGSLSTTQLGEIYNIPHQHVSRWVKQFSSELSGEPSLPIMTEQEQKNLEALQKQINALEKKLEYEQMRNFALETMADLAKTELGIDIRKNFGAKQPKE